jgi:hypothetical protein
MDPLLLVLSYTAHSLKGVKLHLQQHRKLYKIVHIFKILQEQLFAYASCFNHLVIQAKDF